MSLSVNHPIMFCKKGLSLFFTLADSKGYLVVMCSVEDENQSYLASALDSYETKFLHIRRDVKNILKNTFCMSDIVRNTRGTVLGAVVDDQRY